LPLITIAQTNFNNRYPVSAAYHPPPPQAPSAFSAIPTASMPVNQTENGRTYHGFREGKYMFPCDEVGRALKISGGMC